MRVNKNRCVQLAASVMAVFTTCAHGAMAQATEKQSDSYQTFYLKYAISQNAANDIQTAMRNLLPGAKIYYAATENALMVRGTGEELGQAQRMLMDLDKPQKVYRVTYTLEEGAAPRHISVLVSPGKRGSVKQGTRVPIMTGSY